MNGYFLGVDAGATKSHVMIANSHGEVVGFGTAGNGNPDSVGQDGFALALKQGLESALADAGLSRADIVGAGFGVAGYDWPSQRADMLSSIATLGLSCPIELVNDALIALMAGATQGWGVAVVAGTSCNAWGIGPNGRYGRMAGYSWLGEYAGSQEIVDKSVQAVAKAWTLRAPKTALTQAYMDLFGAASEADLIEGISLYRYNVGPAQAPLVFTVAQQGDAVAQELVHWAGAELGDLAVGIIRQLALASLEFEIILSGSFYKGSSKIQSEMEKVVKAVAPHAHLLPLTAPAVIGGVLLGMKAAQLPQPTLATARHALQQAIFP